MKQKFLLLLLLLFLLISNFVQGQTPTLPAGVELPDNIVEACSVNPPAQEWKIKEVSNSLGSFSALHTTLVGDIDEDGKPEILAVRSSGTPMILDIIDGETLTLKKTLTIESGAVQLVDLDLDGHLDVVVSTVIRDHVTPTNSTFYMYVYS